jgi:hypothetical protein
VRAKFKYTVVAIALICGSISAAAWLGVQWWPQLYPQDFEQCSGQAQSTASSEDARISLIARCDWQYPGRRKMGGGYTYYDFLQNRHFDIAGPTPTPNELKHFDEEYTLYLDAQRRDPVAAAIAKRPSQSEQADARDDRLTDPIFSPGPPIVMTPTKVPIPRARSLAIRSKDSRCEDASLSCSWTNVAAGIRKFFDSYAKADRP